MTDDDLPPFITKHGHRLVLALTSLVILYWFWPEVQLASIFYNDGVSHSAIIRGMDLAWARGGNVTDFWMGNINFGHALLRSYQFLFHLVIWTVHKTLLSGLTLSQCFNVCITAMAMALPWSVYKGCRILGLGRTEAVIAAVALVMLHERDGYGLGLTNFTFSGYGTYNQLFAMLFFPLTVGYAHRMLRNGKHWLTTSLLFAATFMAHILTGYFACLWIAIDAAFVLLSERNIAAIKRVAAALARFGALTLLWTGHWVLPMAQDGLLQHKSEFEAAWKWTGYGAEKMLGDFWHGDNMDADRFIMLSLFSALGMVYCLTAWLPSKGARKRPHIILKRYLGAQAVLWLLLTFGPYTWGPVLNVLPFASALHWHRVFGATQFAFMLCLGVFLANMARNKKFSELPTQLRLGLSAAFCTLLLVPCLIERKFYFYDTNVHWLKETYVQWEKEENSYAPILEFALKHDDARFEAGNPWTWGNEIKVTSTIPLYALLAQFNVETVGPIHHHQNHSEVLAFKSDVTNAEQAELMNVRYVTLPLKATPPAGYTPLMSAKNGNLYDNGNKTGYFAVGRELGDQRGCADNEGLSRSVVFYLTTHLVHDHVYPAINMAKQCAEQNSLESQLTRLDAVKYTQPLPGNILSSKKEPGPNSDIHLAKVHMSAPGILLFKMNYHPGWHALVDGKPAETQMVVPSFTAIHLSPGDHDVRFSYDVAPLKRLLLYATLLGLLGLIPYTLLRRKK